MRYYISDVHFFHRKIKEMDNRMFNTLFEMNNYIIEKWNKKVSYNDEVYIIGDFSFGKGVETWELLGKLNGKLYLIEGNHDYWYLDDPEFIDVFEDVQCYSELTDGGRNVVLSHYPIPFYNYQFRKDEANNNISYMLYGHVHNTFDEYLINRSINDITSFDRTTISETIEKTPMQMINVFCVYSDYEPKTLDEWIEIDKKRRAIINQKEAEAGGKLSYQQWMDLNDLFLQLSKDGWK